MEDKIPAEKQWEVRLQCIQAAAKISTNLGDALQAADLFYDYVIGGAKEKIEGGTC